MTNRQQHRRIFGISTITALSLSALTASALGQARIVITEIMYDPDSYERNGQAEWVEIANLGDEPVEITDWYLDDEDPGEWGRFTCTLTPGQVAVLINADAVDEAEFREAWGLVVSASADEAEGDDEGKSEGEDDVALRQDHLVIPVKWQSLANSPDEENEILQLKDADGNVIGKVNLQQTGDWPRIGQPDGMSIYLTNLKAEDLNDGVVWKASENGRDHARMNEATKVFDGQDIGSPGYLPTAGASASVATASTTSNAGDQAAGDTATASSDSETTAADEEEAKEQSGGVIDY